MRNRILLMFTFVLSILVFIAWSDYSQEQPETLPLVPMMQQLLTDIQNADQGIYTEQYTVIADAAGNIANHPVMTPDDKELVKSTLGSEMKEFVEFDRIVHHHADSMRMAALEENMQDVLHHYRIVQSGCVDCHTHYREKISDARSAQIESYEE